MSFEMSLKRNYICSCLFYVICLSSIVNECWAQKEKRGCEIRKLEDNLMPFIGHFGYPEHRWPENNEQLIDYCKTMPKAKIGAKNHTNVCLKGMVKSLISVLVYSADKVNRLYCKNKKERINYIDMGECGNSAKKDTTGCWNMVITLVDNIRKLDDPKEKLARLCCSFYEWRDCTLESVRKPGLSACKESVVNNYEQFIDRIAMDPMKMLCSDYEDSDRCDKVKTRLDRTPTKSKYRTPFQPAFEVIMSL